MIGERLGRYRIEALLGRGGMGAVYRAVDDASGEGVALKVLPRDAALDASVRERFAQEAELLSGLAHENVVSVKQALATDRGHAFYVMELVEGQSLARILEQRGKLEPEEAVAVALAVLSALEAAHARGIVHRDVKPGNVLLARGGKVKVVDFGLARALDATRLTLAGQALGTPAYMSPEQADAKLTDARSDIYSTGVLLYELLSGKPPFRAESPLALLRQHVEAPVPPISVSLPSGLEGVVRRALEKEPARRFQTAGELAQALRSLGLAERSSVLADLAGGAETRAVTIAPPQAPVPKPAPAAIAPARTPSPGAPESTTLTPVETPGARTLRSRVFAVLGVLVIVSLVYLIVGAFDFPVLESRGAPTPASSASPTAQPTPAPAQLPFGIAARAQKGDWASYVARTTADGVETSTELLLEVEEASESAVGLEISGHQRRGPSARSAVRVTRDARVETLGTFISRLLDEARTPRSTAQARPSGPVVTRDARVDDRDRTVSGRVFHCKRAFITELRDGNGAPIARAGSWDVTAWLSPDAGALGLVALSAESAEADREKIELELAGFGSPTHAEMGELPDEIANAGVNVEEVSGPPPETAATGSPGRTPAEVSCLAFTADGTRCLVASGDALELRELESGKLVRSFEQPGKVRAIAVPDAKTAITCDEEGALVRWNLTTGERERAKEVVARVAACVPDMERVLVGDAQGVSEVWDYAVTPWKKVTREPLDPSGGVTALAISRTGRALVGSAHGFVWAVNLLESDKHATLVVDHGKPILAVGFSKDARHAIVATEDEVRFFTAGGATLERRLGLPGKPAAAVVLPSQGDHALVLAPDGSLRLVDLTTARGASPLDLSAAPYDRASAAAFSRDGRSFLVGTKNGLVLRFEITGK